MTRWLVDLSGDLWVWNPDVQKYLLSNKANASGYMLGHSRETIEALYGIDSEGAPDE